MTDSPLAPGSPPLQLAQLKSQTGGDQALEREVLSLFLVKSETDLARIAGADSSDRRHAAHGLVGSARAVGAAEVARLAAAVEHADDADGAAGPLITALGEAVATAQAFIRKHLTALRPPPEG